MKKFKLKTKKAAAKRFKVTGTGKIRRYKAGNRHLLGHERSKVKRSRQGTFDLSPSDLRKVQAMIPGI